MRWAGRVAFRVERRDVYRVLVGKPEIKKSFGKSRRRWEENIKMDLYEVGYGHGLDQAGSGYEQMAGSCKSGSAASGYIKCGEFLE